MAIQMRGRNLLFLAFLAGAFILYLVPLVTLFRFAWGNDTFSYIPLVPLVSAWLIYGNRKEIFSGSGEWSFAGVAPVVFAMLLYALWLSQRSSLSPPDALAVMALSFVCLLIGWVGIFYGVSAWRVAAFPTGFLLFMVPIPSFILDSVLLFLQRWSASAAYVLFGLTGVPLYRDGFLFHLPGLTIEVARECSGIRSSISLFLVSLLAGHLMLRTNSRKGLLTLSIVPITILKNAVRIVTLSLLAVYVDPRMMGSAVHRMGGIPFFILALVLLSGVLYLLRRGERKGTRAT
jgi:exosortase